MAYEDRGEEPSTTRQSMREMVQKSGQSLSPCVEVTGHHRTPSFLGSDDEEPRAALRDLEPSEIQHVPVSIPAEPSELGEGSSQGYAPPCLSTVPRRSRERRLVACSRQRAARGAQIRFPTCDLCESAFKGLEPLGGRKRAPSWLPMLSSLFAFRLFPVVQDRPGGTARRNRSSP